MKLKNLFTLFLASCAVGASAQTIVTTTPSNKNIVLEELTGKTCQFCPDGHLRAQQLADNNPGRVVLLNIHTGSYAQGTPNYRTAWGDYVGGLFSVSGYPTGTVNRRLMPDPTQANPSQMNVMTSRGRWATNGATIMAEASPVNVGGNNTINLDNRQITLDVEAYYTAAGTGTANKFHAVITQDNIPGPQTGGATWNPGAMLPNGDYNHKHMVRHNLTPNAGDNIGTVTMGSLYTNQYVHTMPAAINAITVNMADLHIALFVSEGGATDPVITGAYSTSTFQTATPLGADNGIATLDASLGLVCGTNVDATMRITNMGNAPLTTATFQYTVNGGTPGTIQHTFTNPVATGYYEDATISVPGLTPNGASSTVDLSITMLNGTANPGTNVSNGHAVMTAASQSASSTTASFTLTTDNYGSETDWELKNESTGATVMSGGGYPDQTGGATYGPFTATLVDGDCYSFLITDGYGDGICCGYGNGSYSLTVGSTTFTSGGQFTSEDGTKFVFDYLTGVTPVVAHENDIKIMPNPVHNNMTLEFTVAELDDLNISVINALGQQVAQVANGAFEGTNVIDVNTSNLVSGVYFLNITSNKGTSTKRFVVEK